MSLPETLKSARKKTGLSLQSVSEKTNIDHATVARIENGFIKDPGFYKIFRLAKLYKINLNQLGD